MPDYSLPASTVLVFGRKGCGKTTFCHDYLLNARPACRFVYDSFGQTSARLGLRAVTTARECELALPSRWVVVNPLRMFEERSEAGFDWFCSWVLDCAKRDDGRGKKIVYVDEPWQFMDSRNVPANFQRLLRLGRPYNVELLLSTHRPRDYASTLRGEVTEWVCFDCREPAELDAVRPWFGGVDAVAGLPVGTFLSYDTRTDTVLRGQVPI